MEERSGIHRRGIPFIITLHHWMLASSCFSCILLLGRIFATDSFAYIFLPWNLFLAFVPYWITGWVSGNASILKKRMILVLTLAAWLIFIPNSFYIITDLVHFARIRSAPKWFDLLMIFSFAWNGILFGIVSLRRVEIIMNKLMGRQFSILLLFCIIWLCAFGVYIGRYLRFNSWDILTDPFSLAGEILDMLLHPFEFGYAWGMTLSYSLFISLLYFTIKKIGEPFYTEKKSPGD